MGPKRSYPYKDKAVEGQQIDFTSSSAEAWNTYTLEDGTTIKMKTVLLEVARLSEYDDKGNPVYVFSAHQIIGATVPDELKKKD